MRKYFIICFMLILTRLSSQNQLDLNIQGISLDDRWAANPYLTLDEENAPVLCWTSQKVHKGKYELVYAKWNRSTSKFDKITAIPTTKGMQNHKESMGKIGFKSDGTMVAVFGVKRPIPSNRFAGYVGYTKSHDGVNWSARKHLVTDTLSQSQRFFDLERLADGELGMTWLDNRRLEPEKVGSTLYFAKTNKSGDFVHEKAIAGSTCQCCRTDIFVTPENGVIHVAFRDIIQDTIRDMMHLYSQDNGLSFSPVSRISEDNWVINGCPHTGPSIATNDQGGLAYTWFTAAHDDEGVYFARSLDYTKNHERVLINSGLSHPQMIGASDGRFLLIGDEMDHFGEIYFGRIVMYIINSDGSREKVFISKRDSDNSHPVIIKVDKDEYVIAWTKHLAKKKTICYVAFSLK